MEEGIYGVQIFVKIICQSNTYYTPGKTFTQVITTSVKRVWTSPLFIDNPLYGSPPILYFIFPTPPPPFLTMFFINIDPNEIWDRYKNKLIKNQQIQNPYAVLTLLHISHPKHTSIWITPHFYKRILSYLFYDFSKISTTLTYKRGFTIQSSPRQRKFTHSPRHHFSEYVTPTSWKGGEKLGRQQNQSDATVVR